jgi:hypothetical protein
MSRSSFSAFSLADTTSFVVVIDDVVVFDDFDDFLEDFFGAMAYDGASV